MRSVRLQAIDAAFDDLLRFADGNLPFALKVTALSGLGQGAVTHGPSSGLLTYAEQCFGMAENDIHIHEKLQKGRIEGKDIDTDGSETAPGRVSDSYALSCRTSAPFLGFGPRLPPVFPANA
jgi:hypothetical protein